MIELLIHLIFHEATTTTVSGSMVKTVVCERCAYSFPYFLTRKVTLRRMRPFGSRAARKKQLLAEANGVVRETHQNDCDAVPCPECGWYQSDMLRRARGLHGRYFESRQKTIGLALLICAFAGSYGSLPMLIEGPKQNDSFMTIAGIVMLVASVGPLLAGIAIIRRRNRMFRKFDPNAEEWREARIIEGRRREREALAAIHGNKSSEEEESNLQEFND